MKGIIEQLLPVKKYGDSYKSVADVQISFFPNTKTVNDIINEICTDVEELDPYFGKMESFQLETLYNEPFFKYEFIEQFINDLNLFEMPYIIDIFINGDGWLSNLKNRSVLVMFDDGNTIIKEFIVNNSGKPMEDLKQKYPVLKKQLDFLNLYASI